MRNRMIGIVALVAAACGGGGGETAPEVRGMYRVTHHTWARGSADALVSCSEEGADSGAPLYFRLGDDDFFPDALGFFNCSGSDPATCDTSSWESFLDQRSDGWEAESWNTQTGGGSSCQLYHTDDRLVLQADGTVRIDLRDWYTAPDVPESECSLADAEALPDQSDCLEYEVYIGEPI